MLRNHHTTLMGLYRDSKEPHRSPVRLLLRVLQFRLTAKYLYQVRQPQLWSESDDSLFFRFREPGSVVYIWKMYGS
jgi:hypothetical protein